MIDSAKKGNSANIDTHIRDLGFTGDDDDVYSQAVERIDKDDGNVLIFPFGKAVGKKIGS